MSVTKEQVNAGIQMVIAVGQAVKDVGRCPSGVLYSALMSKGITWDGFHSIIGILVRSGAIRQDGDMLVSLL